MVESPPGSGKTMTAAAMAVSYKGDGVQLFLSTANVPVINMALAMAKLDYGSLKVCISETYNSSHLNKVECELALSLLLNKK